MGRGAVVEGDGAAAGFGIEVVDVETQHLVLALAGGLQVHQLVAQQGQLALEGRLHFLQVH